ncbi:N-acetyltransferase [Marinomonas agarivorans]|nr:N-acetyltransferase [Marinomonas agarivorans]
MTIRAFTPQDYSQIATIYHKSKLDELRFEEQTFTLLPLEEDEKRHQELMESAIYVYENDVSENGVNEEAQNRILGYVALFNTKQENEIRALFVDPTTRGQGIGKKLFEFALQQSHQQTTLYVAKSNTPAKSLYQAYGFTITDEFLTEYNGVAVMANKMQLSKAA